MAYQSLYRRYRPQTFGAIRGQPHLVAALRNAVVRGEVGHAYLLHGPRGTGKTSSARVLAKALNCESLSSEGEPCGICESCVAIEQGRSFDLHELDAAGNNRVEDMRALLAKVSLGTPGRVKVYVLDEVHMLTSAAENALLKTLEEPPDHVVWVLATTEPHKVVDTIRSRCQSFELSLLGADELADHIRWVIDDAGLSVEPDVVDHVVATGGGSVRDTLSALDRVVAAGGMVDIDTSTDALLEAIAAHDVAAALSAIGDAGGRGRDPRAIGESVLAGLRDAFLVTMEAPPPRMTRPAQERAARIGRAMPPARITGALDVLGRALVDMRQAPDPRVDIEVALVRLCRNAGEQSVEALAEELQRLKQRVQHLESSAGPDLKSGRPATQAAGPPPIPPSRARPGTEAPPADFPAGAGPPGPASARRALADKMKDAAAVDGPNAGAPAGAGPPGPTTARRALADKMKDAAAVDGPNAGDPAAEHPKTKTAVVQLAHRYFGIPLEQVADKSQDLFGPGRHELSEQQLCKLWQAIVEEHAGDHPAAPAPDPRVGMTGDAAGDAEPGSGSAAELDADAGAGPTEHGAGDAMASAASGNAGAAEQSASGALDRSQPRSPDPEEPDPDLEDEDVDLDSLVDAPGRIELLVAQVQERFPGAKHHAVHEAR